MALSEGNPCRFLEGVNGVKCNKSQVARVLLKGNRYLDNASLVVGLFNPMCEGTDAKRLKECPAFPKLTQQGQQSKFARPRA